MCDGEKKTIMLVIISIIVLLGVIMAITINKGVDNETKVDYEVVIDSYSDYESQIIYNYEQYLSFAESINKKKEFYGKHISSFDTSKYNEEYFDSKSLAIININIGNSGCTLKSIDNNVVFDTLVCTANIEDVGAFTDDINGKLILVEVNKSVTKIVENCDVKEVEAPKIQIDGIVPIRRVD